MDVVYFSNIEFEMFCFNIINAVVLLSISRKELSVQKFNLKTGNVEKSYGIKLTDVQVRELLPYCNATQFEPYKNREMSMNAEGYVAYRDEYNMRFIGVTDSYIPKIELPMEYYYDEEHIWPSEKLYRYLLLTYFDKCKKIEKWWPVYGSYSMF